MTDLAKISSMYCGVLPSVQVLSANLNPDACLGLPRVETAYEAHSMVEDTPRGGGSENSTNRSPMPIVDKYHMGN